MPSDSGVPGTPASSPSAAPGPASKASPADSGDQFVTREEYQAQSNVIGGLRNQVQALVKQLQTSTQTKPTQDEPGTVREELERVKADIRAEREAARKETREAAINSAISAQQIDSDSAEILFDHVVRKYGDSIKTEGRNVYYESEIGEKKPVKEFIAELLKGPRGDKFKPAPATSSLPRGSGSNAPAAGTRRYSEMSQEERLKLPPAERWALAAAEQKNGV